MSNRCKVAPHSLDHDLAGHLRMNRTEVRISSALLKVKENFSSVSSTLDLNVFESSVLTHRVRDIVTVDPCNRGPDRHRRR